MFYVYLLQSSANDELYFGYTNDLRNRIEKHNSGKSIYTRRSIPWKLVYYEAYASSLDAIRREKQLKRFAKGYASLKNRIPNCIKKAFKSEGLTKTRK